MQFWLTVNYIEKMKKEAGNGPFLKKVTFDDCNFDLLLTVWKDRNREKEPGNYPFLKRWNLIGGGCFWPWRQKHFSNKSESILKPPFLTPSFSDVFFYLKSLTRKIFLTRIFLSKRKLGSRGSAAAELFRQTMLLFIGLKCRRLNKRLRWVDIGDRSC